MPAGRHKDRPLSSVRDTHHGRGRAVERYRSSLAMPHPKPVGSHAQHSSETHCSHAERTPSRRKCRQLISWRPVSKAALRTVTSKWSMSMTCMGAWLGGRGLTYGGRHTHPKRKERQRASPPTLYREAASKRIASRAEGWAAAQPLLRSASRLGECSSQAMCAVHSSLAFAVPCHAEAACVPSIAVRSFFRIF